VGAYGFLCYIQLQEGNYQQHETRPKEEVYVKEEVVENEG
jgi:hypothetical protein